MHLEQVYAGLAELHNQKYIDLSIKVATDINGQKIKNKQLSVTRLKINNTEAVIDTHDNFGLYVEPEILQNSIFYFKRAYQIGGYPTEEKKFGIKVLPYGLNYAVYGKQLYWKERYGIETSFKEQVELLFRNQRLLSKIFKLNTSAAYCNTQHLAALPNINLPPKAILMTRVWAIKSSLPEALNAKRKYLNDIRTTCIEALQSKFDNDFLGGLFIDEFSIKQYPHLLLSNNALASKKNYLAKLKNYPIAVSINGTYSSGWSLGEYTALSKAIVTDTVQNEITFGYTDGKNYLSCTDASSCVNAVQLLFDNTVLRQRMMQENYLYYQQYLQPELVMKNIIDTMLGNV